jgi:hypothetical protein
MEMLKNHIGLILFTMLSSTLLFGQSHGSQNGQIDGRFSMETTQNNPEHDHSAMNHPGMDMPAIHDHQSEVQSAHLASGTSWQPFSTPHTAWMWQWGSWNLMAHGVVFLTYNQQGGARGSGKAESVNWLMFDEQRRLGRGSIELRQMLSAEPLTAPHGGFRELFQTGETYHGQPLVDMQHPHDVFGELAVTYNLPVTERTSLLFYGGPAGEPALGPVAYVHRASAAELPAAPLGHHVQDSTHISFGVLTSGLTIHSFRIEGSLFNGHEPDENRATVDFAPLHSWSTRASFNPGQNWSMQYSYGHLQRPEATELTDIDRQTASITYNRPLESGNWTTSLIWGRNHKLLEDARQNSYGLESTVNFLGRNYAYTRLELIDKDELFARDPENAPSPNFTARIGAYTFGGVRDLVQNEKLQVGLGADLTFYSKPSILDSRYGDDPASFRVFLRFRPGKMKH